MALVDLYFWIHELLSLDMNDFDGSDVQKTLVLVAMIDRKRSLFCDLGVVKGSIGCLIILWVYLMCVVLCLCRKRL